MTKCPILNCTNLKEAAQITCFRHWRRVPVMMKKRLNYNKKNAPIYAKAIEDILIHVNGFEPKGEDVHVK